jgi:excinuclease UvrABC ATPase subunit
VFDTLATEAQRQLYENFSLFIRNFLPKHPQPDADAIENLPLISRQAYGFRNFENYRLRVKVFCG